MQNASPSSLKQIFKKLKVPIRRMSLADNFIFFAPRHKPMTLLHVSLLKLTPKKNSKLPFQQSH
jgi:hypothetical protein